jgi:hypothetical protein
MRDGRWPSSFLLAGFLRPFSPKAKASDLLPTPSARIFRDAFEYRGAPPDSERRRRLDTTSSEFV